MNSPDQFEIIDQFIFDQLSPKEITEFEKKLSEDEGFAEEFEKRKTAHAAIDFLIADSLREDLQTWEKEETKVISLGARRKRMYSLAIAASVAILIGAFFFIVQPGLQGPRSLALGAYEMPSHTLRSDQAMDPIDQAFTDIENNELESAIARLAAIGIDHPRYILSKLALGHAKFQLGAYREAESEFVAVLSSEDIRYQEEAEWFRLLSCVAQKQSCEGAFNEILEDENHEYLQNAEQLNRKIN